MTFQQLKNAAGPNEGTAPSVHQDSARILCLGDVVGRPGRRALTERLPALREAHRVDMVIANGENAAGGIGLTAKTLGELLRAGVDVVTSGNHIWKHKDIRHHLDTSPALLRPANYSPDAPGRGSLVFSLPCGFRVGVLNLLGRIFMDPISCPFAAADAALAEFATVNRVEGTGNADRPAPDGEPGPAGNITDAPHCVIVDFHAEASSEKRALLHYLDGRVAAVVGTHTHVQTADAYVTAAGTASITDLGMCGVEFDSVIGMGKEAVLKRFTSGLPQHFSPAKGTPTLNGVLLEIDKRTTKALSIFLLRDMAASPI